MRRYEVISGDGHCEVPVDMWKHWVPEKYHDTLPKLYRDPEFGQMWKVEYQGESWERSANGPLLADWDFDEFVIEKDRYYNPDGSKRPGTGDGAQRLREQDRDGIDAEVIYPPVYTPFAFHNGLGKMNREAHLAFIRGFNDWLAQEFCAVAPDRLIGNALMPETGYIEDSVAEIERCRKMGLRGMALQMWPNGGPHYKPEDDRFFATALDLDMRLAPHGTFGGQKPKDYRVSVNADTQLAGVGTPSYTIGQLIGNGVFDRFPKLKVYFAETNPGWLAHTLDQVDESNRRWAHAWAAHPKKLPSMYYRDHCMFSFILDRSVMPMRHQIGLDLLMWGSDFPHSTCSFPDSRRFLEDLFGGVPENEKRQILVDNPCRFYGLDPEQELTPTP